MPPPSPTPAKYVCVISDATGTTAQRVTRATLAQFRNIDVEVELIPEIKTVGQIESVVSKARERNGLVAYTLVDRTLRNEIAARANEAGVVTVDLIGPLMASLSRFLSAAPAYEPGLFHLPSEEEYARLEAVAFAVRHDDGLNLSELPLAEVVIVGPSRTSKTPLSVYLAHTRGLKVANVPLALEVEPFQELLRIDPRRVVALTANAQLLSRIREARLKEMGNPSIKYASLAHVERELHFCHEVYRRSPAWTVIDVTGRSVEEIAAAVCAATVDAPPQPRGSPGPQ